MTTTATHTYILTWPTRVGMIAGWAILGLNHAPPLSIAVWSIAIALAIFLPYRGTKDGSFARFSIAALFLNSFLALLMSTANLATIYGWLAGIVTVFCFSVGIIELSRYAHQSEGPNAQP